MYNAAREGGGTRYPSGSRSSTGNPQRSVGSLGLWNFLALVNKTGRRWEPPYCAPPAPNIRHHQRRETALQFGSHHQDVQPTTRSLTQVPQCICSSAFALQPRSEGGTAMGRSNLLQEAKYSPSSHTPRPTEDADAAHLTSAPQVRRGVSPRLSALARAADWRGREISPLRDDWLVPNPTSRWLALQAPAPPGRRSIRGEIKSEYMSSFLFCLSICFRWS